MPHRSLATMHLAVVTAFSVGTPAALSKVCAFSIAEPTVN